MPVFHCKCVKCGSEKRVWSDIGWSEIKVEKLFCPCGYLMGRAQLGPSASKLETLDNGWMARSVERLSDAERLFKERAANADPLAGGVQGHGTKGHDV